MTGHLSELLAKFQHHTSCLHYLFEFHVWHPESSPVNHSDIQFARIDDSPPLCHFYLGLMSSLFFVTPPPADSSSRHSDIANYFKLSGRQFQFQLNLVFRTDLGVGDGVALSALNSFSGSYGCHLRRNLNSILARLQWIHTEFTLVKTEVCSVYVFQ